RFEHRVPEQLAAEGEVAADRRVARVVAPVVGDQRVRMVVAAVEEHADESAVVVARSGLRGRLARACQLHRQRRRGAHHAELRGTLEQRAAGQAAGDYSAHFCTRYSGAHMTSRQALASALRLASSSLSAVTPRPATALSIRAQVSDESWSA